MSDDGERFWQTTSELKSKEEAVVYESPEQAGQRLVVCVRGWLTHALEQLPVEPEDCRAWFRVNLEPPGFSDPQFPHLALGELQYLVKDMPSVSPGWWELNREQRSAIKVLLATRKAIHATWGTAIEQAPQALGLLDHALSLGITVSQVHVEPWEVRVEHRLAVNRDAGRRGGNKKREQAKQCMEKARSIWESLDKPEHNKASIVAERMGVPADTVRRWRRDGWRLRPKKADTS